MKTILILAGLFVAFANTNAYAQSCSGSPLFTQGKQFVYLIERPNIRGGANQTTKQIKATYVVQKVTNVGGATVASYSVVKWEDSSDPNAKPPSSGVYTGGLCNGNAISYTAHVNIGATVFDDTTEIPANIKVGDKMKDKTFTFSIPGKNAITVSVLKQSTVVAQEKVTTPAGTWNCFKIAVTSTSNLPAMGTMPASTQTNTEYGWFAPGLGLIKSQVSPTFSTTLISIQ